MTVKGKREIRKQNEYLQHVGAMVERLPEEFSWRVPDHHCSSSGHAGLECVTMCITLYVHYSAWVGEARADGSRHDVKCGGGGVDNLAGDAKQGHKIICGFSLTVHLRRP